MRVNSLSIKDGSAGIALIQFLRGKGKKLQQELKEK